MTMTMIEHSSSVPSPHRMVKWIVLVSSTMAGVLLVSLTIAKHPPLPISTTTSTSTSVASLRTAAVHSTAEITMRGSSLSTSSTTTPSSTTTTTTTTPSGSSSSNTTMMAWSNALLSVKDDKKKLKSVADEAQQQLVPLQQGPGHRPSPGQGQGRPLVHKGEKKDEEQVQQLSTDSDSVADIVAAAVAAAAAAAAATTENTAARPVPLRENENLKGYKSMLKDQQPFQYPNQKSPAAPLSVALTDLIDDDAMEIKKNVDVQFLMDFAVIGHPKCGTTFLLRKWLGQHAEIVMPARETRVLSGSTGAVQMVQALYPLQQLPVAPIPTSASGGSSSNDPPVTIKRGYKNPAHILRPWALQHFETYWPTSKLIIGVRHPVLWFESFYNYRLKRDDLPPPASLMGACTHHMNDVCTDNANFHVHLAMLGKTNLTALERVLLESTSNSSTTSTRVPRSPNNLMHLPNPVFLYDVSQLDGSNVDVSESVRRDMQDYLGLQKPLPILEPAAASSREPSQHNTHMLDICLPEHDALRQQLLQIAWQASEWITTYFLPLSDVTVPAPEHFRSVLLNDWRNDPCETRKPASRPSPSPSLG